MPRQFQAQWLDKFQALQSKGHSQAERPQPSPKPAFFAVYSVNKCANTKPTGKKKKKKKKKKKEKIDHHGTALISRISTAAG
jgi:hypothetical protein